ncbi:MAG: ABC transporter permease [Fimbriiglobus sp.]|jgi:putative ABC transport system permease protein|nr:ABC transporter permease [Fimbriiglobus sp.]
MSYALSTIWYERQRFLPAILAVAFSAVLIAVQGGLVVGLLSMMSRPVDMTAADVWAGYPGVQSVDLGRGIPERWAARVAAEPGVVRVETATVGFSLWTHTNSGAQATPEVITVVGCRLHPDSLGAVEAIRSDPRLLERLAEPMTVAIDEGELHRLGVRRLGEQAEVIGRRVRVVGFVRGYRSLGGPYVFCSTETARALLKYPRGDCSYILARCESPEAARRVTDRLARYQQMTALTTEEFSLRTRLHWLTTTKAGIAVGFTALLGLFVGSVVTSQTLYAAVAASQREFATLRAMGIPSWRLKMTVVAQSLWVGFFGLVVAAPVSYLTAEAANLVGTQVTLHPSIIGLAVVLTLSMALLSGLAALRSFQNVDPAHNIR